MLRAHYFAHVTISSSLLLVNTLLRRAVSYPSLLPVSWINQLKTITDFSTIKHEANSSPQKMYFKCHWVILYYTFPHPRSSLGGHGVGR